MRSESLLTAPGLHCDPISSRAGFLPICLSHLPVRALADIPVYLRSHGGEKGHTGAAGNTFALFRAKHLCFDDDCRRRLLGHNVRFVYIPIAFHEKFRRQTEAQIQEMVDDPAMAASAKWEIVYETSTELANELLSQPNFAARVPRLQAVSKAVSTLVLNDPLAFSHLFAASHHDFYTATHMINVATWMVALAYALGHVDEAELSLVFQAGMVHDVGKTLVPREILNKTGQLTPAEWATLRSHPELGCRYLKDAGVVDPLILDVTLQHHERLDGSGYPSGLTGEQVPPMSRVCAVVDTFDALTALRPFKSQALSVAEAMQVIFHDTPARYDPNVVETWTDLIRTVEADIEMPASEVKTGAQRRKFDRASFNCPVLVRLKRDSGGMASGPPIGAVALNVSRAGIGMLMPVPLVPGQGATLHLQPPRRVRITREYQGVCVRCRAFDDGWYEVGMVFGSQCPSS